jgi:hypothetical protein
MAIDISFDTRSLLIVVALLASTNYVGRNGDHSTGIYDLCLHRVLSVSCYILLYACTGACLVFWWQRGVSSCCGRGGLLNTINRP